MLPMVAIRLQLGEALAADAASLAPAALANKIALIAADFIEDETLELADLTFATFNGATPIAGAVGTQLVGVDPATNEQVITIKDPAGGYRWECGGTPAAPEQIFGFALTDNAGAVLLGVQRFDTPITISLIGQEVNIGAVTMRVVLQPLA